MLAVAPLLLAGLLLAGCGGGSSDSAGKDSGPGGSGGSGGGSSSPSGTADRGLAYAQCMRRNGVPKFPDPQGGRILVGAGSGVDPRSPAFQKAQEACKDLSPQGQSAAGGGSLDPAKVSAWGQCLRDHGLPKFPDPTISGNAMQLDLGASGVSPDSSRFQSAMDACRSKMPQGAGIMIRSGGGGR